MHTFPKPLTPGEERSCLERMKEGDHEARNTLIERNLRLVAHVTRKYQGTDYEMEDLLSGSLKRSIRFIRSGDRGWRHMRRNVSRMRF